METQTIREFNDCFISAVRTAKVNELQRTLMVHEYVNQLCQKKLIEPEHMIGLVKTLLSRVFS